MRSTPDRVADGRIERWFEEHGAELDSVQIVRLALDDAGRAQRVHAQLIAGDVDFLEAAQQQFLAAPARALSLFATLRRREAHDEFGTAAFAAAPGEVLGPMRVGDAHVIARVLSQTRAGLDEATRAAIEQILFKDWLAERRKTARITWHWGSADRTTRAT